MVFSYILDGVYAAAYVGADVSDEQRMHNGCYRSKPEEAFLTAARIIGTTDGPKSFALPAASSV